LWRGRLLVGAGFSPQPAIRRKEMRFDFAIPVKDLALSEVQNDALALWRLDGFLITRSLALPLVFPSANVHGPLTYLMSYYARPATLNQQQGILFAIFAPRYTAGLSPFYNTGTINFTIDQDGASRDALKFMGAPDLSNVDAKD
jgi:hypothetical protein